MIFIELPARACESLIVALILRRYGFRFFQTLMVWALVSLTTSLISYFIFGVLFIPGEWVFLVEIVAVIIVIVFQALIMGLLGAWRFLRPDITRALDFKRQVLISFVANLASFAVSSLLLMVLL